MNWVLFADKNIIRFIFFLDLKDLSEIPSFILLILSKLIFVYKDGFSLYYVIVQIHLYFIFI